MKSKAAASRKGLKPAEEVEDFEAGTSDEEEEELSGSSGGGSGSGSESEGEEAHGSGEEDAEADDFGSDDDMDAGLEGPSSGGEEEEEEEEEEGGSGDEDESGSDSEGGGSGRQQPSGGFLEGGKAASFAKAFAKIVEGSGKRVADVAAQQTAAAPAAAPILAASRTIAKRKAEEEADAKADREAKKLRQEMKQRGHVIPKRRGQDPVSDVREKGLQRLATKGVVRLFNAIAKAQKQLREAEEATGSRAKAVKLGKASFLAQLKASGAVTGGAQPGEALVPSAPARQVAAAAAAPAGKQQRKRAAAAAAADSSDDEDAGGWDVLQQGFVGLQGGTKMKDWDKQGSDEEGLDGDALEGMGASSDDE